MTPGYQRGRKQREWARRKRTPRVPVWLCVQHMWLDTQDGEWRSGPLRKLSVVGYRWKEAAHG